MLAQTWGGDQIQQNNIIPDADCQIQQEIEGCGLCILWGDSCSVIWGQMLHTSHNTASNWENVIQTLFVGKMQTKLNFLKWKHILPEIIYNSYLVGGLGPVLTRA